MIIAVVIVGVSLASLAMQHAFKSPEAIPSIFLSVDKISARENVTTLELWHKGGDELPAGDLNLIIEGVLKDFYGTKQRVSASFSEFGLGPNRVLLEGEGKNVHFSSVDEVWVLHAPSRATLLVTRSIPKVLLSAATAGVGILVAEPVDIAWRENVWVQDTLITTNPDFGTALTLKLASGSGVIAVVGDNKLGIGTTTPTAKLDVAGTVCV